ncbi:MAG: flagellar hook-basal body complex protein [Verrucomicrobia bacterium]|nr:flagellar hook-basal body complex protein [Verrucomicrobiota bacterium]
MALLNSFNSGVAGIKTFSKSLEVIGDNIANVNSTGFKGSRVTNQDNFSLTMRQSTSSAAGGGGGGGGGGIGNNAMQVGTGSSVAAINQQFTQGALSTTGSPSDLGITGSGFFVVIDPSNTDATAGTYVTRAGNFYVDDQGFLVTNQGYRVQGDGGDIQLSLKGSNPQMLSYAISKTGEVKEYYSDGTSQVVNKIVLQDFQNPNGLMRAGDNLFTNLEAAGPIAPAQAGTNGLGQVIQGTLELSNVDLTQQFSDLIVAQRAFQANSRVITVSDSVMDEIVNLKR